MSLLGLFLIGSLHPIPRPILELQLSAWGQGEACSEAFLVQCGHGVGFENREDMQEQFEESTEDYSIQDMREACINGEKH